MLNPYWYIYIYILNPYLDILNPNIYIYIYIYIYKGNFLKKYIYGKW